jgi:biopolymer transport protein ExbB
MLRKTGHGVWSLAFAFASFLCASPVFAAAAAEAPTDQGMLGKARTLGQMFLAGGLSMIFLALLSVVAVMFIIYHFKNTKADILVPRDLTENILSLLERKEYEKAAQVCRQQDSIISAIALKGIEKLPKGKAVVEEAIQHEGKAKIEALWQNLTYLGDIAVIAPLLGLLGTIFGMIDAFNFFKAGTINPMVLTQGLAKAMINTAFGLVIALPAMAFYAYFRGKLTSITSTAERVASEISSVLTK